MRYLDQISQRRTNLQPILMVLTGGKARVPHLLCPLLDMRNALIYSWLCIRTVGRPRGPKSSLEAKTGKSFVFVRALGIRMGRNDHKARPERCSYVEK
jgi:hypothetical protein